MTASQYRATLAALGITQARLGRLLGVPASTTSRWAVGARAVPRAVELLLAALWERLVTIEQLEAIQ